MIINTINNKTFSLLKDNRQVIAQINYTSSAYNDAIIEAEEKHILNGISVGTWITHSGIDNSIKIKCKIKVETGGIISISLPGKKRKYFFKKSNGWKLRFYVTSKDGEDLLALIPLVNWSKESYDYILQLNEEYEKECDAFLILQAIHCANCSLSMMTGGQVPALISI
jgi:hypothetical protein